MEFKQNSGIQIMKNQPDHPSILPNPSLAPTHNPNYICGLNRLEPQHLFNIQNTPQSWNI